MNVAIQGEKILFMDGQLRVPNSPIIPFIEGDGIGPDIWKAAQAVFDAAIEKAYNGERAIIWKEVYAGEKANDLFESWLPDETIDVLMQFRLVLIDSINFSVCHCTITKDDELLPQIQVLQFGRSDAD